MPAWCRRAEEPGEQVAFGAAVRTQRGRQRGAERGRVLGRGGAVSGDVGVHAAGQPCEAARGLLLAQPGGLAEVPAGGRVDDPVERGHVLAEPHDAVPVAAAVPVEGVPGCLRGHLSNQGLSVLAEGYLKETR